MQCYDIHKGKVPVETALKNLEYYIKRSKNLHDKFFGVVVGYGSTGGTHKIKTASIEYLDEALEKNRIKEYILGNEIDIYCTKYQKLNDKFKKDISEDLKKEHNPGVIYIWV